MKLVENFGSCQAVQPPSPHSLTSFSLLRHLAPSLICVELSDFSGHVMYNKSLIPPELVKSLLLPPPSPNNHQIIAEMSNFIVFGLGLDFKKEIQWTVSFHLVGIKSDLANSCGTAYKQRFFSFFMGEIFWTK